MYPLNNLAQESCTILEASAIVSRSRVAAEKLVAEITVAVFDIHEVEAQLPRRGCGEMKVFYDGANFSISEQRIVSR
jgi:hypothetical protein